MNNSSPTLLLTPPYRKGFTFIELLAAMLFMAIVLPVTIKGIMIANRVGVTAERKRVAVQLADNKLTEIMLNNEWVEGEQEGEFTEEILGENSPYYRWALQVYAWDVDAMQVIELTVFYEVQGLEYSVTLCTLAEEVVDEEE
jgi:type II secretory pathway pseudopilin PulG